MKLVLLIFSILSLSSSGDAQSAAIESLPPGRYETLIKQSQNKWTQGDIILLDDNHYKISSSADVGEYRFSATAQRIFFVTGPLKTAFAKTFLSAEKPAIVLPAIENEQQGLKLAAADVIAYLKN